MISAVVFCRPVTLEEAFEVAVSQGRANEGAEQKIVSRENEVQAALRESAQRHPKPPTAVGPPPPAAVLPNKMDNTVKTLQGEMKALRKLVENCMSPQEKPEEGAQGGPAPQQPTVRYTMVAEAQQPLEQRG